MNLIDIYEEPENPAPPTEKELDEVIFWYGEIIQKRNKETDPRYLDSNF